MKAIVILQLVVIAGVALEFSSAQEIPIVETTNGPIQGEIWHLHDGKSIRTFLGVPFAQPPVENLRWRLPEDVLYSPEIFVADHFGHACPQPLITTIILTHPRYRDYDEDCLNMNIFTPVDISADVKYPVMVFFHGGAYIFSANIQYTGHFIAAKDTILVIPNYRLGILGFASTGDEVAPGNYGMHDMIHALKWVKKNIAKFGGDPERVTIFGESAGAGATGLMLVSPLAKGLFHQAIMESGSELAVWAYVPQEKHPENFIKLLAQEVNCTADDNAEMMDCLRLVDEVELRRARVDFNCTCLGFGPVVDGEGGFLPDKPMTLLQSGLFDDIPQMIGVNHDEGNLFVFPFMANGLRRSMLELYASRAVSIAARYFPDPSRETDVYQSMLWYYTVFPDIYDVWMNAEILGEVVSDVGFGFTMDMQIKIHTERAPTYQYVFDYVSDAADRLPDWLGTPHGFELPYVFGYPMIQLNENVRNQTGMIDVIKYNDVDVQYADYVMTLWTNFAKYGNPTPDPVVPPNKTVVNWEPFTWDKLNYLFIGKHQVELRENWKQHKYSFWHTFMNYMINGQEDWAFVPPSNNRTKFANFDKLLPLYESLDMMPNMQDSIQSLLELYEKNLQLDYDIDSEEPDDYLDL